MRVFDYSLLKEKTWDSEIISLVAQIHEYKGRQEVYLKQKPETLDKLVEIAKRQRSCHRPRSWNFCCKRCNHHRCRTRSYRT